MDKINHSGIYKGMRVKLISDHRLGKAGKIVQVSTNVGFGLIDSGVGILTKDIRKFDTKIKALDEEQANGKSTKLRTNKS